MPEEVLEYHAASKAVLKPLQSSALHQRNSDLYCVLKFFEKQVLSKVSAMLAPNCQ